LKLEYKITKNDNYKTINNVLISYFSISTRLRNKLIKNQKVFLNGKNCDTRNTIKSNDIVTINLDIQEDNSNIIPNQMDLDILFEDDWFLVINKPTGILIHPSSPNLLDSLSNGVCFYFEKINLKKKIRPVNRLDVGTSGLVIFAKCEYIHEQLSSQMLNNSFIKEYLCLINGFLTPEVGIINSPIARKPGSIIERCVDKNGQNSITHYEVLDTFKEQNISLVKCILETGRTHQIRVHMDSIGHSLIGDTLYGHGSPLISRQALHSHKLKFIHPVTLKQMCFSSNLPKDIKDCISKNL